MPTVVDEHGEGSRLLPPTDVEVSGYAGTSRPPVCFEVVALDDPAAVLLTDAAQAFYVERYGGGDRTPVDPAEFAPPRGLFLLARAGTEVVGCGGWRRHTTETVPLEDRGVLRPGDAEIKRMWVEPAHRRGGLARRMLAELERTAAVAGCRRTVLETGTRQPESLALYRSVGYRPIAHFGVYREDPHSRCFARDLAPPDPAPPDPVPPDPVPPTRGSAAGTG